jgi:hypothetical protein
VIEKTRTLNITRIKPGMYWVSGDYFIVLEYEYRTDIHVFLTLLKRNGKILKLDCRETQTYCCVVV